MAESAPRPHDRERAGAVLAELDAARARVAALEGSQAAELRRLSAELTNKRTGGGSRRYADGYFDGASMIWDALNDRAAALDTVPAADSTSEERQPGTVVWRVDPYGYLPAAETTSGDGEVTRAL